MLLVQVIAVQVFQGPQAQKERKVIQAHLPTALKESQAPLDFPEPPALVDLQAQQVQVTIELLIWEMK